MGVVDWMKHHWWWLSIPTTLALERLLADLTSINLLGPVWQMLGTTSQHLVAYLCADLTLPAWALIALIVPLLLIISWLQRERSQLGQSLGATTTELEALKQPRPPEPISLSSVEETVFFWAVLIYDTQEGVGATPRLLVKVSEYPLTSVEAALDALQQKGIVKPRAVNFAPVELTPEGRTYIGSETVSLRYARFMVLATSDISDRTP